MNKNDISSLNESLYVISKTQDLMDLTAQDLPLTAFKIIDIYLAHINPLGIKNIQSDFVDEIDDLRTKVIDPELFKSMVNVKTIERDHKIKDWATVIISKATYCKLMNLEVRNVKKTDLINNLNRILEIRTKYQTADMTTTANFFTEASYDAAAGQIRMVCNYTNDQVRSIFFDTGDFKYFQYKLKVSMALKSIHSYKIAMCILKKRPFWDPKHDKSWTFDITVDELRSQMGYENKYTDWGNFSKKILNSAKREICENVDLSFDYTVIERYNHSPTKLRFSCSLRPCVSDKISRNPILVNKKRISFPLYADTDPRVLMVNRYFNARAGNCIGRDIRLDEESVLILKWLNTENPVSGELYSVDDLKRAIDFKREECSKSADYQFLHPKFIFNLRNFERYTALGLKEYEQCTLSELNARQAQIGFEFLHYWTRQKLPLEKLSIVEAAIRMEKPVDIEFAIAHFSDDEMDIYIQAIEADLVDDCIQFCNSLGDTLMCKMYSSFFTRDANTCYELYEQIDSLFARHQNEYDSFSSKYDNKDIYNQQTKWRTQINQLYIKAAR